MSWSKILVNLIKTSWKSCHKENDQGYFFEVDDQYPDQLHELYNDLPFLPERMKVKKVEELAINLHDKSEYVIHIRSS